MCVMRSNKTLNAEFMLEQWTNDKYTKQESNTHSIRKVTSNELNLFTPVLKHINAALLLLRKKGLQNSVRKLASNVIGVKLKRHKNVYTSYSLSLEYLCIGGRFIAPKHKHFGKIHHRLCHLLVFYV